ncbi:MAG: hypothetical protein M0P71_18295 [Melioribacteraceae bacterium]|jgi:hypothetical protein|nr:hypothetical protein [Melioribacteraceae bacterium]
MSKGTANQYMSKSSFVSKVVKNPYYINPAKTLPAIKGRIEKIVGRSLNMSISKTNYGQSSYIVLHEKGGENTLKIRISDHSVTNIDRMFGEVHLHSRELPNSEWNKRGYKQIRNFKKKFM